MTPTATQDAYGTGKWSLGPTLVLAYKVPGKITVGGLFTQVWSVGGDEDRDDVSVMTLLPACTYFLGHGTSVTLASETTHTWKLEDDSWNVPLTLGLGQILPPFGKFFVGVAVGASWYPVRPDFGQEWDVRAAASIVLP